MDVLLKRKIVLATALFLFFFSMDVGLNIMIFGQFYYSKPLFELAVYFLFIAPIFLFKGKKGPVVYSIIISVIFYSLVFPSLLLFESSGDIMSLSYLSSALLGLNTTDFSYMPWKSIVLTLIVAGVIIASVVLTFKYISKVESKKEVVAEIESSPKKKFKQWKISIMSLIVFLLLDGVALIDLSINVSSNEMYENKGPFDAMVYDTKTTKRLSLSKYGAGNYFFSDFLQLVGGGSKEDDSSSSEYEFTKNDYSGLCDDYNVVEILLETGAEFLLNETLTPNIYSLMDDGIHFANNKSKNKTNVSEYIGLTGVGGSIDVPQDEDVVDDYSIVSMLNDEGYSTSYFHSNSKEFYARDKEMKRLKFQNAYFAEDIDQSYIDDLEWNGSYPLDSDFIGKCLEKMIPSQEEPFYTFITTFGMHGPYTREGTEYQKFIDLGYYKRLEEAEQDGKWVNICQDDDEEVQKQIEYLQCAFMDFDVALGKLITRAKEIGVYDRTIFAIYGDHDAYYKSNGKNPLKTYVYNTDDVNDPIQYSTINVISNPLLHKTMCEKENRNVNERYVYTDFTSPYIEVPTLLDLVGVRFDESKYFGISIFRTKNKLDNLFYSHELGLYFTDELCAMGIDSITYKKDENCEQKEIDDFNSKMEEVIQKVAYFDNVFKSGGFVR